MRLDDDIHALSSAQHSCIATWQLKELGARAKEIARLRASHRWEVLSRKVLRLAGSPVTDRQLACAAVLDGGPSAALARISSAALWDLGAAYRLLPSDVMVGRHDAAHRVAIGHARPIIGVSDRWITVVDGIRVVRPELCVYQLCGIVHPLKAERALDTAWAMGLVSGRSLRQCLDEHAEHGRNGTVVFRTLLEARPSSYVPPATNLEARFNSIMIEHGLGEWRRQVDSGGEMWAGRVDFRHQTLPVVAEILSERYHASLSSRSDDAIRRAKLEAAGLIVVEVWDNQVWHCPSAAVALVRDAVRRAKRQAA